MSSVCAEKRCFEHQLDSPLIMDNFGLQKLELNYTDSGELPDSESTSFNSTVDSDFTKCLNSSDYNDSELFGTHCHPAWDKISCWPLTAANQIAIIACFSEFNGVPYNTSQNATRLCLFDGSWAEKADYGKCQPLVTGTENENLADTSNDSMRIQLIHYSGYSISLVALILALAIFNYFKDLHCVRNMIHTNFMVSHFFMALLWIITASIQSFDRISEVFSLPCLTYVMITYFNVASFFWMFVEGLYLYILVFRTFSMNRDKIYTYRLIGWGLPAFLVGVWTPLKYYFPDELLGLDFIWVTNPLRSNCPWSGYETIVDLVCLVLPMITLLIINIFFLGMVICALVTKLGMSTAAEFKQYRKAAKALLVLTPLLGLTYVLLLVAPESGPGRLVVTYLHALVFSTQGFTVAVLYCFLNAEVRNSIRYHLDRWKTLRVLKTGHYPNPVPHSLRSRPRSVCRSKPYRYAFSKNRNSCIVTGGSDEKSVSFQDDSPMFLNVIRYSKKAHKSTRLSEDFV